MPNAVHTSLDDWIAGRALPMSFETEDACDIAVGRIVEELGHGVTMLALGEPMHGEEAFGQLRNRIFASLVEMHGFGAIAIESSFTRGWAVNEYIAGRGAAAPFDQVAESGFSHGFGKSAAIHELIEWMRRCNTSPNHGPLAFYGFDAPIEMMYADSPRAAIGVALEYLGSPGRRERIEALIGADSDWENPAVAMDPGKGIGLSANAAKLRIEVEDLITTLGLQQPERVRSREEELSFNRAMRHAELARELLNYHAGMAGNSPNRIAELLGIRDWTMAKNLAYIHAREKARGSKVMVFAHNSHLQRGGAKWQLGPHALSWWPAGAHLYRSLGNRYGVIGVGVNRLDAQGVGPAEEGTIEARLGRIAGTARFIATSRGEGLPAAEIAALPTRSGSKSNPGYFPLTPQSVSDFDALLVVDR